MGVFTMLWCRQGAGKTELMRGIGLVLAIWIPVMASQAAYLKDFPALAKWRHRGVLGLIVGPNEDRAKIPFKRIKDEVDSGRILPTIRQAGTKVIEANSMGLKLANGSHILNLTGSVNTCKEGETADWIFFDESQDLSSYSVNSTFMPALSTTAGTAIHAGTSNNKPCDFYDKIQRNIRKYPEQHSVIPEWIARTENAPYGPFVDKQIEDLPGGKTNLVYRTKYACEYELTGTGRIISWEQFKGCQGEHKRGEMDTSMRHTYHVGDDVARVQDRTVVTLLEQWPDHYRLIDWLSFEPNSLSHLEQDKHIVLWLIMKNVPCDVVVDSTGIGDVRVENLTNIYNEVRHNRDKLKTFINNPDFFLSQDQRDLILSRSVKPINFIGLTYTAQSKDILYQTFEKTLPFAGVGPKIQWPVCDSQDKDWLLFSQEMLDCELESKGNFYSFHHPDSKEASLSGVIPHDDYVCSLFNALFAAEGVYA